MERSLLLGGVCPAGGVGISHRFKALRRRTLNNTSAIVSSRDRHPKSLRLFNPLTVSGKEHGMAEPRTHDQAASHEQTGKKTLHREREEGSVAPPPLPPPPDYKNPPDRGGDGCAPEPSQST